MKNQNPEMAENSPQPENKQNNPQQDDYDIFVAQGIKMASAVSDNMQGKASIDTLGNALFEIVNKVEDEGRKHGIKFDLSVLLHGSNEILAHLVDMSKVQITEEQVKAVVGVAVGKYLTSAIKSGKMTQEQVVELAKQAQSSQTGPPQPEQPQPQGLIGAAQGGM